VINACEGEPMNVTDGCYSDPRGTWSSMAACAAPSRPGNRSGDRSATLSVVAGEVAEDALGERHDPRGQAI
jgi:hypothetical protein